MSLLRTNVSLAQRSAQPCQASTSYARAPAMMGCRRTVQARAMPDGGEEISDAMKADLERFRAKAATQQASQPSKPPATADDEDSKGGLKETLDKVLIADFFIVLAVLGWLAAGVAQSAISGGQQTQLLDAWFPLWPLLWQPAIGVLMAGALVSGGLNWLADQQAKTK